MVLALDPPCTIRTQRRTRRFDPHRFAIHEFPGRPYRALPRFVEFNRAARRALRAERARTSNARAPPAQWRYVDGMAMTEGRVDFRAQHERNGGDAATSGGVAFSIATAVFNGACNPLSTFGSDA